MEYEDKSGKAAQSAAGEDGLPDHRIGLSAQHRIGVHLQAMYQRVLKQPVPDRFVELIAQLEAEPAVVGKESAPKGAPSHPEIGHAPTSRAEPSGRGPSKS